MISSLVAVASHRHLNLECSHAGARIRKQMNRKGHDPGLAAIIRRRVEDV